MKKYIRKKHGFTLVELSIVLVIIGLIVGGVVGGQSLVRSAKITYLASELKSFQVMFTAFELQYDAIPGDMVNAEDYWGAGNTDNGDGDGQITWAADTPGWLSPRHWGNAEESRHVWEHLTHAELLPSIKKSSQSFSNPNYHSSAHLDGAFYYVLDGDLYSDEDPRDGIRNAISLALVDGVSTVRGGVMTPVEMRSLDKKVDDGMATTGKITAHDSASVFGGAVENCEDTGAYDVSNDSSKSCRLNYWLD
jgi:prepilin-type N-terminal cleavage/methylation domain-containing protein